MNKVVDVMQIQWRMFSKYSRMHAKKIKPGVFKPNPAANIREEDLFSKMKNNPSMTKDLLDEFQETGDLQEPDVTQLGHAYHDYERDKNRLNFKMKREKMYRKHFKEFTHKDPSILTYAEKENIRYLHKSDPEHWTPEKIAEAFPITPDGAAVLIRCKFGAKTMKQIVEHDMSASRNVKLINEGVIHISKELENKMTMRRNTPLTIGAYSYNQSNLPETTSNICGEFESLVAAPNSPSKSFTSNLVFSNTAFDDTDKELMTEYRKPDNSAEFEKLHISPNKYMMLTEFESEVKKSVRKDPSISDPQLDYLLSLDDQTLLDSKVSKASGDMWTEESVHQQKAMIRKYNPLPMDENECDEFGELVVTNSSEPQPTILEDLPERRPDKIMIPHNIRKPGAMYKVGDSYFDDNGDFLYRVI